MHLARAALASVLGVACSSSATPPPKPQPPAPKTLLELGLDPTALDRSAEACTDVYRFSCGGWQSKQGEQTRRRADEARDRAERDAYAIIGELKKRDLAELTPAAARVRTFFAACEAEVQAETAAIRSDLVGRVRGLRNRVDLAAVLGELHELGITAYFSLSVRAERGRPAIAFFAPSTPKPMSSELIASRLNAAGYDEQTGTKLAQSVVALIASLPAPIPGQAPTPVNRDGLGGLAPGVEWQQYFAARDATTVTDITAQSIEAVEKLGKLLAKTPLATHRALLVALVVGELDRLIPLTRSPSSCLQATAQSLGRDLGGLLLERRRANREIAAKLVGDLRRGLAQADPRSAANAGAIKVLVGVEGASPAADPKTELAFGPNHAQNVLAARRARSRETLALVGKMIGDNLITSAAPSPLSTAPFAHDDALIIPAGFLSTPIVSVKANETVNLGTLAFHLGRPLAAATIGHSSNASARSMALGVAAAFSAHRGLREGAEAPLSTELNDDQLFFVAAGQSMCESGQEAAAVAAQVNQTLSAHPAFSAAFSCERAGPDTQPAK